MSLICGIWDLIIGVDSPVNIASFIITVPWINRQSHGIAIPSSCSSNISPGTNSVLGLSVNVALLDPCSFLKTLTGHEYLAILWIFIKLFLVSQAPTNKETKVVKIIIEAYNSYWFVIHKITENTWNK